MDTYTMRDERAAQIAIWLSYDLCRTPTRAEVLAALEEDGAEVTGWALAAALAAVGIEGE